MASIEELRAGVCKSLPEIAEIKDDDLRDRVVEAWRLPCRGPSSRVSTRSERPVTPLLP